jgi:hypothetical protein
VGAGTATFGSGSSEDFSDIQTFDGGTTGHTTFQPGTATGITFDGASGASVQNRIDLTGEPAPSFSAFTVAMSGAAPCTGAGEGSLTSAGAAGNLADCFSNISVIRGAAGVPTSFEPDPNLTSTPSPVPLFSDGVVDVSRPASPDSTGEAVSGLKISLHANTEADPGEVSASVSGNAVTFADFYDVNALTGSSSLTTGLDPGSAHGVTLTAIAPAAQAITFSSKPPSPAFVGGTYAPTATGGGSGNAVTFSIGSQSARGVCALTGPASVHFARPGSASWTRIRPATASTRRRPKPCRWLPSNFRRR